MGGERAQGTDAQVLLDIPCKEASDEAVNEESNPSSVAGWSSPTANKVAYNPDDLPHGLRDHGVCVCARAFVRVYMCVYMYICVCVGGGAMCSRAVVRARTPLLTTGIAEYHRKLSCCLPRCEADSALFLALHAHQA
jgi:hypothetical protein